MRDTRFAAGSKGSDELELEGAVPFCAAPGRDALNRGGAAASTAPCRPEPMAEGVAMALRCVSTPGAALALVRPLPPLARPRTHGRWVPARPTRPGSRRPTSTSSRAASSTATSSTATSSSSSGAPPAPPGPSAAPARRPSAAPRRRCVLLVAPPARLGSRAEPPANAPRVLRPQREREDRGRRLRHQRHAAPMLPGVGGRHQARCATAPAPTLSRRGSLSRRSSLSRARRALTRVRR